MDTWTSIRKLCDKHEVPRGSRWEELLERALWGVAEHLRGEGPVASRRVLKQSHLEQALEILDERLSRGWEEGPELSWENVADYVASRSWGYAFATFLSKHLHEQEAYALKLSKRQDAMPLDAETQGPPILTYDPGEDAPVGAAVAAKALVADLVHFMYFDADAGGMDLDKDVNGGDLVEYFDLLGRVEPGELMPAGECPDCGALSHFVSSEADWTPNWSETRTEDIHHRLGKLRLVNRFMEDMQAMFIRHIEEGDLPAGWDGHELRCWIAKEFEHEAAHTIPMREKRSKRYRDFVSACANMPRR
jgi:hypothetical protein